jgi:hypothetical protein
MPGTCRGLDERSERLPQSVLVRRGEVDFVLGAFKLKSDWRATIENFAGEVIDANSSSCHGINGSG